jgi:hypothetical protein
MERLNAGKRAWALYSSALAESSSASGQSIVPLVHCSSILLIPDTAGDPVMERFASGHLLLERGGFS